MRTRVFGHLLTLSPDALDRRRLGDVLTRLGGDVAAIEAAARAAGAHEFIAALPDGYATDLGERGRHHELLAAGGPYSRLWDGALPTARAAVQRA